MDGLKKRRMLFCIDGRLLILPSARRTSPGLRYSAGHLRAQVTRATCRSSNERPGTT
jgi:hypothetical protein